MDLTQTEMDYFIDHAARGFLSFSFEDADAQSVYTSPDTASTDAIA